jgi:uncharacterized membrane protein
MEEAAKTVTIYISHGVEIAAAFIVGFAVVKLFLHYLQAVQKTDHNEILRVQFGSAVAVALELLLGADVLATAVAPSWDDIGKLAAIAILRTALNFFLEKELHHLQAKTISLTDAEQKRA